MGGDGRNSRTGDSAQDQSFSAKLTNRVNGGGDQLEQAVVTQGAQGQNKFKGKRKEGYEMGFRSE